MAGPTQIFDRALLDERRLRTLKQGVADFLLRRTADDLAERLKAVKRHFALAAEIGSPSPLVGERLTAAGQVGCLIRLDHLSAACPDIVGDEELLPFRAESLDLAVSALAFQFVGDLPGTFAQIRRALKPDGLFLAAFFGGETLTELRASFAAAEAELSGGASPRVAPFAELRAVGGLLQRAGFALPVTDQDRVVVRYPNPVALMHDLRAMGASNALVERSRIPLRRSVLIRVAEVYRERFGDADGRIRATFDIISVSGWAPHESQQKPLRPGSAKTRLADALGTVEHSAGEKAGR
jgi:SAM-dependent methyltransferase